MTLLAWVTATGAIVLVLAGVAKVRAPELTGLALAHSGLPHHSAVVRAIGLTELSVATTALVTGNRFALALLAIGYLAFTVFIVQAKLRGLPLQSCGCFGRPDTPPTWFHAGATTIVAVAASSLGASGRLLGASGADGLVQLALAAVAAQLVVVMATDLQTMRVELRGHR